MAINQPMGKDDKWPLKLPGEHFIMERKSIEFEVIVKTIGTFKGAGRLLLTTKRIILVNDQGNKDDKLKTFDLPLTLIFKESFE